MFNGYYDIIDRIDGYTIGRLIVEDGRAYLLTEDNEEVPLIDAKIIEIRNGREYHVASYSEILSRKDAASGNPPFAGAYVRMKGGGAL